MIVMKKRVKPRVLSMLEALDGRSNLSVDKLKYLSRLQKGYAGELLFDSYSNHLKSDCLVIHDLQIEMDHSYFQIDSLIIFSDRIYIYEVKNFEGSHSYSNGKMLRLPDFKRDDPFQQQEKCEARFQRLLHSWGTPIPVEKQVVFINPTFSMYQAPMDKGILFLAELENHFRKLSQKQSKIEEWHLELAKKLVASHQNQFPYHTLPPYSYERLKKGLGCPHCRALTMVLEKRSCICFQCGKKESVSCIIKRHAKEFQMLFPKEPINSNIIYEWCGGIIPRRSISTHLKKSYTRIGVGRGTIFK